MPEIPTLPSVTERSWAIYLALRDAALNAMRHGVLPNIDAALTSYDALDKALKDPDDFDAGDVEKLTEFHPKAIALVEPAIAAMRQYMEAVYQLAQQVDAGFIAAGRPALFGVKMPVEEKN